MKFRKDNSTWAPVWVPTVPLPTQFSAYSLEKHWKIFGMLTPFGRPKRSSWFPDTDTDEISSSYCRHLGNVPVDQRPSLSLLLFP